MTLCGGWSYTPTPVKSPLVIFQKLQSTAIGDGNLLLSWGMKWDGAWDEKQKGYICKVGDYLKSMDVLFIILKADRGCRTSGWNNFKIIKSMCI